MRVLILSNDKNIFESGSEVRQRMIDYSKLFDELHIVIFTSANDDLKSAAIAKNVFVYPTNTAIKLFYFLDIIKIVKLLIVSHKLSVITSQDVFELGFAAWLIKKIYKIPLQLQVHTDIFSPYFWRESAKNKIRVLLAKFLLPKADGIRTVSERIRQSLISNTKCPISKISVLPISVDIERIKSAPVKTDLHKKYLNYDFIILMASRLTKEKNIGLAIKTMSEIVKHHPKTLLLIVGSGPEKQNLEYRIKNLGLGENVVIESWTDELASYYKTADCFLLTSNYEGYGRTVIEAMACGLSVIMTDVGLAGEILKNDVNGLVTPVGDVNGLVKAVNLLLENKEKRRDLAEKARKFEL